MRFSSIAATCNHALNEVDRRLTGNKTLYFGVGAGLILIALLLRLVRLAGNPIPGRDEALYITMIRDWAANGVNTVYQSDFDNIAPLYFYVCQLPVKLGIAAESAGRAVSMGCGVGVLLVLWGCAVLLFKSRFWQLAAVAAGAVSPYAVRSSGLILRESLALLLFMLVFYLLLRVLSSTELTPGKLLACAALTATGGLARLECLELIPLVAAVWGWQYLSRRRYAAGAAVAGGMIGVFLLTVFGWLVLMGISWSRIALFLNRAGGQIDF